jgi:signal transduction histidine kinase
MTLPPNAGAECIGPIEDLGADHDARRELERELARLRDQNAALLEACVSAEAANQARGQFISGMWDEIRTPLNGLVGMSAILAQTRLDPNQTQITRAIETSARSLNTLLHDVLELAALDAGQLDLDLQSFSLDETAADLESRHAPDMAAKGLVFEVRTSARARGAEVIGDAPRIRQAIGRLLRHALNSIERGEVTLDLDLTGDGELTFAVTGAGDGVDPEDGVRLFRDGLQEKGPSPRPRGRNGLGLAIARALVEAMSGFVRAEACAPEGGRTAAVRFTACLPLVRHQAKAA